MIIRRSLITSCCVVLTSGIIGAAEVSVSNVEELRRAVAEAKPGTTILIAPGEYQGGHHFRGLKGEPNAPIVIRGADAKNPPIIRGRNTAFQFSAIAHVEVSDLILTGATDNGLNIDDGGDFANPSHHVALRNLVVRDVGPEGNHDGIKLSGIEDFVVEDCLLERWGAGGSGIDMVGCHRGVIQNCTFRHNGNEGSNGVQAKGGTSEVAIRHCRFENAGERSINLGGSTGLQFFRPKPQGYEAKDLLVEDCTFLGSSTPVAFVGVDGAIVRRNTIYAPRRWVFRVLQETRAPGFVPSRNGQFTDNLIAYRSDEMSVPINIGPDTAPETFTVARNAWYCLDNPKRPIPKLPIPETGGIHLDASPFRDADRADLRPPADAPPRPFGARERAQGSKAPDRSASAIANPSTLKEGQRCLIELKPEKDARNASVSITYGGVIAKADDNGLALTVSTMTRQEVQDSPLSGVPILNRLTRNIGIANPKPGDKDAEVWIPAEKIDSVRVLR